MKEDFSTKKIDWDKRLEYESFLTIFYKYNDEYICLHDSNIYKKDKDKIYCSNLIPLKNLLPKISNKVPEKLSTNIALNIFDSSFKENTIFNRTLYNSNKLPLDKFHVGTLKFCSSISNDKIHIYRDVPKQYILSNNGAKLICFSGYEGDTEYPEYDYITFKCLLLEYKNKLLNLHNHQIYPKVDLKKFVNRADNWYQDTLPFTEYLENKNIKYNKNEISVPKALKLYKK